MVALHVMWTTTTFCELWRTNRWDLRAPLLFLKSNRLQHVFFSIRKMAASGGASYGAKGLKPPPPDFVQAPPDFCIKWRFVSISKK